MGFAREWGGGVGGRGGLVKGGSMIGRLGLMRGAVASGQGVGRLAKVSLVLGRVCLGLSRPLKWVRGCLASLVRV